MTWNPPGARPAVDLQGVYMSVRVWTALVAAGANVVLALATRTLGIGLLGLVVVPSLVDGLRRRGKPTESLVVPAFIDITAIGLLITGVGLAPVAVAYTMLVVAGAAALLARRQAVWLSVYGVFWMAAAFVVAAVPGAPVSWTTAAATAFTVIHVLLATAALGVLVGAVMQRLSEVESQRKRLVGSFAHEIKNALTGAVGIAHLLKDGRDELEAAEAAEYVRLVATDADEALAITEDLLAATLAGAGELSVASEDVDVVTEVRRVIEASLTSGSIPITAPANGPVVGVGDGRRVRQITRNLLSNAERHGGERVKVSVSAGDGVARLQVADDGPGIPQDEVERVFEPFRTGSRRHRESVGLGLDVSRRLARLMNGDLTYRHDGGWSVFELTLPLGVVHAPAEARVGDVLMTRTEEVWMGSDGILRTRILPGARINLDDARSGVAAYRRLAGDITRPILIRANSLRFLSREARDHFTRSPESAACLRAAAMVVAGSPVARLIVNNVNRYGSPPFPTQVFEDEGEALEWLTTFR